MTKWITLIIFIIVPFFVFAQTTDPFISQVSSLLQTITNLANQIKSLEGRAVLSPTSAPVFTPSNPRSGVVSATTNSYFRRSSESIYDLVRREQARLAQTSATSTSEVSLIPQIISVSPTSGPIGTKVTIKGLNFSQTGNILSTGYTQLSLNSPDGQTLTFTLTRPPSMPVGFEAQSREYWQQNGLKPGLLLGFYVRNANGATAKPGLFFLTLN